jgi:hypothetical protein
MKKIILITFLTISAFTAQAQICDVAQSGQQLQVFNCSGNRTASKFLMGDDQLVDFSESLIVVKSGGNNITVYDDKFNMVSTKFLFDGDVIKNVIGDYIIVRDNRGMVTIYDKNFSRKGSRYE